MRHLLAAANVDVLRRVAWARVLVGFDFDGTLAPIVPERGHAKMRTRTLGLFAKVCRLYPCAVISGRSQEDVARRLRGAEVKYVIGNHGLEPGVGIDSFEADIRVAREIMREALGAIPGVEVEDKRYSLAIHYRRARRKREARTAIRGAIDALPTKMRAIGGKLVINVVPERAPNKGTALVELREKERADVALYVGDDVTDEDVFELDQPGRLLTVRVGASKISSASYFLRRQTEVDALLARLVDLRSSEGPR